jgi:hypothetical protein
LTNKRYRRIRTLLLGFGALLAIIYGLIFILDMPAREVFQLLLASVIIVAALALAGFIFSLLWFFLAKLIRRK